MNLDTLAESLHVFEPTDKSDFQRRARVLQSIWREDRGIPCGEHHNASGTRRLGSRLPMPDAEEKLTNFLTENIREVVKAEVCGPSGEGKLFGKPRIFNLFGELRGNLDLVSAAVRHLPGGDRFVKVTSIDFEWSPGRGDARYLEDRSAFDVLLRCETTTGGLGFIAIEVKYHENLQGPPGRHRSRYDEVSDLMGCFKPESRTELRSSPLQQIWRDHLLAGITRIVDGYGDALFVMLYPRANEHVSAAVRDYSVQLKNPDSFASWTIEDFVAQLRELSDASWIGTFIDRYLAFDKIDRHLNAAD